MVVQNILVRNTVGANMPITNIMASRSRCRHASRTVRPAAIVGARRPRWSSHILTPSVCGPVIAAGRVAKELRWPKGRLGGVETGLVSAVILIESPTTAERADGRQLEPIPVGELRDRMRATSRGLSCTNVKNSTSIEVSNRLQPRWAVKPIQ